MTSVSNSFSNREIFLESQYHEEAVTEEKDDVMGKDAFLTMMVAQLKHQDPLNPLDGTDFTAQLAQFSSLEQAITMNTTLEDIKNSLSTDKAEQSVFNYLGKEIVSDGNPVTLENGTSIAGGDYKIDEPAVLSIIIYNENGNTVRTIDSGSTLIEAGSYNINWDGRDDNGYDLQDGEYTYDIIAKNSDNKYISVSTSVTGKVDGITTVNGSQYLLVNGNPIDPSSVETVKEPVTSTEN
jgi:flagellar basal-body rod modification protein FlgD